jgi:hypothetical protein
MANLAKHVVRGKRRSSKEIASWQEAAGQLATVLRYRGIGPEPYAKLTMYNPLVLWTFLRLNG